MVRVENRCCGCNGALYPCNHCRAEHTPVFICDCCGEEVDTLYWFDNEQYCEDCVLKNLVEVEVDG